MPKFRTQDIDLVTACLISWQARRALTFTYADDSGARVVAHGVVVGVAKVWDVPNQAWDITYLAEV